jgi:hypothetical protein
VSRTASHQLHLTLNVTDMAGLDRHVANHLIGHVSGTTQVVRLMDQTALWQDRLFDLGS